MSEAGQQMLAQQVQEMSALQAETQRLRQQQRQEQRRPGGAHFLQRQRRHRGAG